jgi:hypothetical protein
MRGGDECHQRIHNRPVKNHSSCTADVLFFLPFFRLLHETNVEGKGREMSDVMTVKVRADPLFFIVTHRHFLNRRFPPDLDSGIGTEDAPL